MAFASQIAMQMERSIVMGIILDWGCLLHSQKRKLFLVHEAGRKARRCDRSRSCAHSSGIPRCFATHRRYSAPWCLGIPALQWRKTAAGSECMKNSRRSDSGI